MRGTVTYKARDGKVYAHTPTGVREVSTALTANGRDVEKFEKALNLARSQRETTNTV